MKRLDVYGFKATANDKVGENFLDLMAIEIKKSKEKRERISLELQRRGIKAWLPNDGWHNREVKSFQMANPYFDMKPVEGDLVAIGFDDEQPFTIVRVIERRRSPFFGEIVHYFYEVQQ